MSLRNVKITSGLIPDDLTMGDWVYCCAHLRPHTTGWCTVGRRQKICLGVTGRGRDAAGAADAECRALGLHIVGETTPCDSDLQHALSEACDGRHYRSLLLPEGKRRERDVLLAKLRVKR